MTSKPATPGTRHPATYGSDQAWLLANVATDDGAPLYVWRTDDGAVVMQNDECDIVVPAGALRRLAEAALAVHVHNGRPDAAGAR